jgi:hypothetical protein
VGLALAALLWVLPSQARAEDAVAVRAEVVHASNQGNAIDPPELAKMKDTFSKSGFSFTSYKRLSEQRLSLKKGAPQSVSLPNGKKATLKLESIEAGTARIGVEAPPVKTTLSLGKHGSLFQQVGQHQGGHLILVLSPGK